MPSNALLLAVSALVSLVAAQSSTTTSAATVVTHVVTVANNQSATNGTSVFTPQVVNASLGDIVFFNFTQGNHSATQSDFATPCIPLHDTNVTLNGFDTGIRPAGNGTSVTNFVVVMNPDIVNTTIWFYDQTTCGIGGVGVINPGNVSATLQTIDGFVRNAERLNGTGAKSSSVAAPSATGGAATNPSSTSSQTGSGAGGGNTGAAAPLRFVPATAIVVLMALGAALVV
ncbi:Le.flp1-like protein [Mycena sanguinolenta]|nr:Le.flp1-like protein [Mycena sanguinolenta]